MREFLSGPDFTWALIFLFGLVTAVAGGASRIDSWAQLPVQVTAAALLAAALATVRREQLDQNKAPLLFAGACVASVAMQLIPLPAALWTQLPGRDFYQQAADIAGIPQPARPISLSPDLTWSSLTGLLPPLAALLGLIAVGGERASRLVLPIVLIAAASAILGLAQLGGGEASLLRYYAITNNDAPVGFFANRNHQAILLAISIPMVAYWAQSQPGDAGNRLPRGWIGAVGIAVLLPMILLTGSRAGMFLAVVGLAITVCMLFKGRTAGLGGRKLLLLGIAAATLVLGTVTASIVASRAVALNRFIEADYTAEARVQVLGPAIEMIGRFFPLGAGFGTFDPVFRRFEPYEMLSRRYMNQAHSDLLQLAIEAGAIGLLLLAAYLVWWARRSVLVWRGPPTEAARLGRLGSSVTGMILLASLVEYPLRTPFFAVLFVIGSFWMFAVGKRQAP